MCKKTFADYVIFQNSGAEALRLPLKLKDASIQLENKKKNFVIKNSFHGRTLATIFASGSKKMTEGFGHVGGLIIFFSELQFFKKNYKKYSSDHG